MIFVLGIFLALLPLSFDTIKKLDSKLAGIMAISISIVILLIIKNFWGDENEKLSFEANFFVICISIIAGVVCLLTYKTYTNMTLSFFDMILNIFYLGTGIILSGYILKKIYKKIENNKKIKFLANLIILALFIFLATSNVDIILNDFLIKINLVFPPILTVKYQSMFFAGMYSIIFIYGVFISGLGYFGKELFYKKIILKLLIKMKNAWIFIKNKFII